MNISLVGYMGSGKSSIGRRLAEQLELEFFDLDEKISEIEQSSITEIFQTKGEIYFRKKEHEVLKKNLENKSNYVLSVGGGTPLFYGNIELINNYSQCIYLRASPITLAARLFKNKEHRPLIKHIKTEEALQEFIAKHLFERQGFYFKAKFKVIIDTLSQKQVIAEIVRKIQS